MFRTLFHSLAASRRLSVQSRKSRRREAQAKARLQVERLEARDVPTIMTVTNEAQLAAAINYFDQNGPGTLQNDVIQIPSTVQTIPLTYQLPPITCNLQIQALIFGGTALGDALNSGHQPLGFPIFTMSGGVSVVLSNLLLIGGSTTQSGGGIQVTDGLSLTLQVIVRCYTAQQESMVVVFTATVLVP